MSNNRAYWIRSTLFTLLQRFSVQLFALGSVPLLLRGLSKYDMGVWALFLTTVSVLEVGRIGLLQNALVKYLTTAADGKVPLKNEKIDNHPTILDEPERSTSSADYRKIATASLTLNGMITILMVVLFLLGGPLLADLLGMPELTLMFQIYTVTTVILMPFMQSNYMGQANLDFKGMFWGDFTKQGLFFAFILFLYFTNELNIIYLAGFQIVTAIFGTIATWLVNKKYLRFDRQIDAEWVRELFRYGIFVFATNLSTMLYKSIDKWMLGGLVGAPAVAAYDAAIRVTNMVEVPTFAMSNVLFPQSARRMNEGKEAIKRLYEKSVGAIFSMLLPAIAFVLIFADVIIWIIGGEKYEGSGALLRWTILYGLFIPFAIQFGTVLDSIGKPVINFAFTLGSALLNVVLNYIFITNYGIVGAAWGTLITYSITFIFMQSLLRNMFNVNPLQAFRFSFEFYAEMWNKGKGMLKVSLGR